MNKTEENYLKRSIRQLLPVNEEIYKLAALLSKYCEFKKDSDDLYEVSIIAKILTEKINNLSIDLYHISLEDIKPFNIKNFKNKIAEYTD